MSAPSTAPLPECPVCEEMSVGIVVNGPDADAIQFSCGCPVPLEVVNAHLSGSPVDAATDATGRGDRK
jgi:hypothetical protein